MQVPWSGGRIVEMVPLCEKIRQGIHCFVKGDKKNPKLFISGILRIEWNLIKPGLLIVHVIFQ